MGDDQVTLREAAALAQRSTRAILYHYHSGRVSATLVKDRLWFSRSELASKLPGGLPGLSAVQPEVPTAGSRLVPSPASVAPPAPSATRRARLSWRSRVLAGVLIFSTVATYQRLAMWPPVPDEALWPFSHRRALMIVALTLAFDLLFAICAATLACEDSIVVAKHAGFYWVFVAIRYEARRISVLSSQLRRGRGDRQQNRPPRVRWSARELLKRAA